MNLLLAAGALAEGNPTDFIRELDAKFRTSNRYIPAAVLWDQGAKAIGTKLLRRLSTMTRDELIEALARANADDPTLQINQGVAENLIKLHTMAKQSRNLAPQSIDGGETVRDLPQPKLDKLVEAFPQVSPESVKSREFNYPLFEMQQEAKKFVLDNDLYNFKVAAGFFGEGMHKDHKSSFSLFSRGKKNRPFMLVGGTELAVDMLKNLKFTEREIQYLKNHKDFHNVKPEFWDYLRNFKFNGTVRAVKSGTTVFANEPILEVTGNPVEVQIAETLILPIINAVTTSATKTARVVQEANGRPVVEGGTRRGFNGILSAYGAYLGGAAGTSNAHVGRIWGIPTFGTMNHSWVEHFDDELEAFSKYKKYFPEASFLIDNYDIEQGVRNAIIAAGKSLKGVRLDSTIPGKNKEQTAKVVRDMLDSLGYKHVPITYSDGLDEFELRQIKNAPFQIALVGTEIAAPSDNNGTNVVYKVTQITKNGARKPDPIKVANGKVGMPGEKQVWRVLGPDGKAVKGYVTELGEPAPPGGVAQLTTVLKDGKPAAPLAPISQLKAHAAEELGRLPTNLKAIDYSGPSMTVEFSPKLRARQSEALAHHTKPTKERVGVIPLSADPITDAHITLAKRMKLLYNLDRVIFVPTPDKPLAAVGKNYLFTGKQRVAMIQRRIAGIPGLEVYTGEVDGGKPVYFVDTLSELKKGPTKGAEVFVIGGEDLARTLSKWKGAKELVRDYNWLISSRDGVTADHPMAVPTELLKGHTPVGDRVYKSPSGKIVHMVDLNIGDTSSTDVRKRYADVTDVFHQVDTQLTFWKGMHGEKDGPLAVTGSPEITKNVELLNKLAYASHRIKSVASVDWHYDVEVKHADQNGEFHPNPAVGFPGFPPHAMANEEGPLGPGRIPESEIYPKPQQLVIPHNEPEGEKLALAPYDLDAVSDLILDPDVEIVLKKNGKNSYNVFENPRAEQIYQRLKPKRVFVYGVATDFCVDAAVDGLLDRGYETYVVTDAISGVYPELSAQKLEAMKKKGAHFVTTAEVLGMFPEEAAHIGATALLHGLNPLASCKFDVKGLAP